MCNSENHKLKDNLKEKWHKMLGHINFEYLEKLSKNNLFIGMPTNVANDPNLKCITCIENKIHCKPFKNNWTKSSKISELVHTDLNGPQSTIGNCGEKYYVTFTDDYSKLVKIYPIKSKSETVDCIISHVNLVENQSGKKVQTLRVDNGREYQSNELHKFANEKGIILDFRPPYFRELNGTVERLNRTGQEMGMCLMNEAKVTKRFWPEVIKTVAYLKNRSLANTIEQKTPFEIFFDKKPDVSNLRVHSKTETGWPQVGQKSNKRRFARLFQCWI